MLQVHVHQTIFADKKKEVWKRICSNKIQKRNYTIIIVSQRATGDNDDTVWTHLIFPWHWIKMVTLLYEVNAENQSPIWHYSCDGIFSSRSQRFCLPLKHYGVINLFGTSNLCQKFNLELSQKHDNGWLRARCETYTQTLSAIIHPTPIPSSSSWMSAVSAHECLDVRMGEQMTCAEQVAERKRDKNRPRNNSNLSTHQKYCCARIFRMS